jgi:hypothetical protein
VRFSNGRLTSRAGLPMSGDKMQPLRFIWVKRLDGLGEDPLDLFTCRRFAIVGYNTDTMIASLYSDEGYTYYLTRDKLWVEYHVFDDYDEDDHGQIVRKVMETYYQCHAETVAHRFHRHKAFKGRLPSELEDYRIYGDTKTCETWIRKTHVT